MELSHAISDAVLTLMGICVFFRYLLRLPLPVCLSWGSFVLSVTLAALFGTLRFLGVMPAAVKISELFQHSAGTIGAFGLVFASVFLALRKPMPALQVYEVLALGLVTFSVVRLTENYALLNTILTVSIPVVFLAGLWGLFRAAKQASVWLLLAVVVLIAGTFNKNFMANSFVDSTNLYHYLLAISLLCFGRAARHQAY